jgi:excisionase family DNA binding protein
VDELLTVAEIAERLKVNQQTVRNWIDRGELVGIRVGSSRARIRTSDLERYYR